MMGNKKALLPTIVLTLTLLLTTAGCGAQQEPPTPTIPPTHTAAPTPTITPIPTIAATVTPTSPPDYSLLILHQEDLPSGFDAIPLEEFGLTKEDLSGDGLTVESSFAFWGPEYFEFIVGFTILIPGQTDQEDFDEILNQPELMMESLIGGLGGTAAYGQEELPYLNNIGDASAGMTVVTDLGDIPMRMDMTIFRKGIVGAFVIAMYLDGEVPFLPIDEVSNKLVDRIVEVLYSTE